MRELCLSEIRDVSGGDSIYSVGYTVGSWFRAAADAIQQIQPLVAAVGCVL